MAVPSDFWATSAQTLPVLALAQILEARAITSRWSRDGRWSLARRLMLLSWLFPVALYGFLIPVCLGALQGNDTPAYYATLTRLAVGLGATTLIINPIINLLAFANAGLVARFVYFPFGWRLRLNFRVWRLEVSFRRQMSSLRAVIVFSQRVLDELTAKHAALQSAGFSTEPILLEIHQRDRNLRERLDTSLDRWDRLEAKMIELDKIKLALKDERTRRLQRFEIIYRETLAEFDPMFAESPALGYSTERDAAAPLARGKTRVRRPGRRRRIAGRR